MGGEVEVAAMVSEEVRGGFSGPWLHLDAEGHGFPRPPAALLRVERVR